MSKEYIYKQNQFYREAELASFQIELVGWGVCVLEKWQRIKVLSTSYVTRIRLTLISSKTLQHGSDFERFY